MNGRQPRINKRSLFKFIRGGERSGREERRRGTMFSSLLAFSPFYLMFAFKGPASGSVHTKNLHLHWKALSQSEDFSFCQRSSILLLRPAPPVVLHFGSALLEGSSASQQPFLSKRHNRSSGKCTCAHTQTVTDTCTGAPARVSGHAAPGPEAHSPPWTSWWWASATEADSSAHEAASGFGPRAGEAPSELLNKPEKIKSRKHAHTARWYDTIAFDVDDLAVESILFDNN